jgi:hypothetical protein
MGEPSLLPSADADALLRTIGNPTVRSTAWKG